MRTRSRQQVCLSDPRPDELHLADALWGMCGFPRYGNHTEENYCVGQHSVLCYRIGRELWRDGAGTDGTEALLRTVLLHDMPEGWIGDVLGPLKKLPELDGYRVIEDRFWHVCARKFGLLDPMPDAVKEIDRVALRVEMHRLWGDELTSATRPGLGGRENEALAIGLRHLHHEWTRGYALHQMMLAVREVGLGHML